MRGSGASSNVIVGVSGTDFVARVWLLALWPAANHGALETLPRTLCIWAAMQYCKPTANLLFPNSFAMARALSLWRSIEKKSLNLRLEGRWVGINTKIHRPFASLELARCVKHQTHARHAAYCRGFESRLELFS